MKVPQLFLAILFAFIFVAATAIADDSVTTGDTFIKVYSCEDSKSQYKSIDFFVTYEVMEAVLYGQLAPELKEPLKVKEGLHMLISNTSGASVIISGFDVTLSGKNRILSAETRIINPEKPEALREEVLILSWAYTKKNPQNPKVVFVTKKKDIDWNAPMDQGEKIVETEEKITLKCSLPGAK